MDRVRRQLGLTDLCFPKNEKRGVTVAVLDSGITYHPDLQDRILEFRDFTKRTAIHYDSHAARDEYGHGTHVCGIICGNGGLSQGRYQGICPGAKILMGKILDERGDGTAEDMLKGMEWILETKERYDIRLVNVSVGIGDLRDASKEKRLRKMLSSLADGGLLVICAAGNQGPLPGSLSFLGEGKRIISVGCHDGEYYRGDPSRCESYSGRGFLASEVRKPDVVAPGTRIRSCSGRYRAGMRKELGYEVRSGTSMAAPIVTGCLARALEICPEMTAKELKRLLTGTARDLKEPWNKQGWGMVCPREMLKKAAERKFRDIL